MPDTIALTDPRFDTLIDRSNSHSVKWAKALLSPAAQAADPLPMWVADMDFRAPQPVIDALHEAVEYGVFGYPAGASASYQQAVTDWQAKRFGWQVDKKWLLPSPGIITALKASVQAFSAPGDTVLIQPPVYGHFHGDVLLNGRQLTYAPLTRTETGYRFDAERFEAAIKDNTRLFILSNPHNPTGNVWSEEDLMAMGEICLRHNVLVVSDEIHQDLIINPAKKHRPFAAVDPRFAQISITCTAPSKTFNLPGLQNANLFIANPQLRGALARQFERNMAPFVNTLGMVAAEAAYRHGEPWLDALLGYLRANHQHFANTINGANIGVKVLPADALYLAWMDCRGLGLDADDLQQFMLTQARVWLDSGQKFGAEGHGYMRVNLGCPRTLVTEAANRIIAAVQSRY
ncbi:MalY/PatB family protein [Gallaecimonas mangrovi]|uniref:MalY/PatB family protein n=1 Tax=Gallaecimonas mangrovi TaxID=2291597 RepID=UPI000E1FB57D|nr:MalY/PatB family protein [Gallaecimonas mangrovi]